MTNTYHVIKDPVHGTMSFSTIENRWTKPFIDSPNFQRLRHIKQLGLGDYIFPGAVHTRFNHCLGCSYVANQIARKVDLSDHDRQLVTVACLLHDIGHGPFSHAFEGMFDNKVIRHEDWTPYFLAEYATPAFFKKYNECNPGFELDEAKFKLISDMIMHNPVERKELADIVSSQLDADRLDYLLRDGHFCGVRYGEYDLRWMLHCLTIVEYQGKKRLGVTYKGIGVVEHYLMARRLIMRNISYQQKKLALEFYLIQFLSTLSEAIEDYAPFASLKDDLLGKFLLNVNQFNEQVETENNHAKLKENFLEENYHYYKALGDYDVFAVIKQLNMLADDHPAVMLAKRLQNRTVPELIRLRDANINDVQQAITEFKDKYKDDFYHWQLMLIQTPHQSYSDADEPILVKNEDDIVEPIGSASFILGAMSDQLEHAAFVAVDLAIKDDPRVVNFIESLRSEDRR